jgi:hypothetical protein
MGFSRAVFACGLCHEDDRSAVYSYEAVQKAKAQPDKLEFVVLKVTGALPSPTVDLLSQWLKARAGVDPETVKISAAQKSIGLVMKRTRSKETLAGDLQKDFQGLRFHVLPYN